MNLLLSNFSSKSSKRNSFWIMLLLVSVLAIASLACGSAAVTEAPAEDAAETDAPTEEVAPSVAPTRGPNPPPDGWRLVLQEDFADDASEWGISTDYGHNVTVTVHDGVLNWLLEDEDASTYRWPGGGASLADFMASVDVNLAGGDGTFGLAFREQSAGLYAFRVTYFGEYMLQYLDDVTGWETLIDWTETGLEGDEVPHRLAVRAEGDHFILYVNDQQVGEYSDSRLEQGIVGLIVGTYEGSSRVEVQFDNLMIWAP